MSKILKAMLVSAYTVLFIQYLIRTLSKPKVSIELEYLTRQPGYLRKILKDIKKYGTNMTLRKLSLSFIKPKRLPTDLKYVLKWTEAFSHYSVSSFTNGQNVFFKNKCKYTNCYMTNDKSLLLDVRYYDAILFDVENNWDNNPLLRAPHQYYIFTASESASNFPICDVFFESYYNLTWSYKLNSDIRWSFFSIFDKNGSFVGPKIDMSWVEPMKPTPENVIRRLVHKKKAAGWFVSNCKTLSKREKVAAKISEELLKYSLKIDIYGWCGQFTCPKDRNDECYDLLEQDYYFYLAFENSMSEDYVTEKLMYPLRSHTVPIVYGGANYSRFLPPGSYLDATQLNATEIAAKINEAVKKRSIYQDYFRWHNHYVYKEMPIAADVCTLCKKLNEPTLGQVVVKNIRQWWNPDYNKICGRPFKRINLKPYQNL